jgi:RNA recognition motif-containing protein
MSGSSFKLTLYNLSFFTTESDLLSKFTEFGRVLEVSLAKNRDGLSKGFGYVVFEEKKDMDAAILSLQSEPFDGFMVHCEYLAPPAASPGFPERPQQLEALPPCPQTTEHPPSSDFGESGFVQ